MHFVTFIIAMICTFGVIALPRGDDYYATPQTQQQYGQSQGQQHYGQQQGQQQYNQQEGQQQHNQQQGYSPNGQQQPETTNSQYSYRCNGPTNLPYCCYRDANQLAQCLTYGGFCTSDTTEMCCPGEPSSTLSCAGYFNLFQLSQFQDERYRPV